jgi:Hydin Adenylate kinase-like domain
LDVCLQYALSLASRLDFTPYELITRLHFQLNMSFGAGKTTVATSLANLYDVPILKIDDIIIASFTSQTPSGTQARELCAEAARRLAEESRPADETALSQRGLPPGSVSTDGLTVPNQGIGNSLTVDR